MDRALTLSIRHAAIIWGLMLKIILARGCWPNKDWKGKVKWLQHSKKGKSGWVQGSPNTCVGLFPLSPKELCCSLQEYWEATHKSLWLSVVQWWEGWSDVDNRQQKMGSIWDVTVCSVFVIETMWDVNESIGLLWSQCCSGLGQCSVSQRTDISLNICVTEKALPQRNAVRWKQSEPGVLVLSGCII